MHFPWAPAQPLSDEKIDLFVKLYRQLVSTLDAGAICRREFAMTDDTISYGPLDGPARKALLENCQCWFAADELAALRRFIDSHAEADDVLAVVIRRAMAIETRL